MSFKYPESALPPKRTMMEEMELRLLARQQYRELRAAYSKAYKEMYFPVDGKNLTPAPPPESEPESTQPPVGE